VAILQKDAVLELPCKMDRRHGHSLHIFAEKSHIDEIIEAFRRHLEEYYLICMSTI